MNSWKKNPVIYEINTWVWLDELSSRYNYPVTLGSVPDEIWDHISDLEIDAVWFMGVWERSPAGIRISNQHEGNLADFRRALPDFRPEDNVGSPYCIRGYRVDEHFGGNEGLSMARESLAQRNIKLILDYVPNHLAHDHPWVQESPEFFIRGTVEDLRNDPITFVQCDDQVFACGKDPYYPAWQDVLQVNVFHPDLREAIIETVTEIAGMCDGVRCDMAMLVLNDIFATTWGKFAGPKPEFEFWEEMIPAVKRKNQDFIFIAEAYWEKEFDLQQMGFDYCYDKRLYDRLELENATSIKEHLSASTKYQSHLIRFTENHDEPRQASAFMAGKNRAASVIASTLPGAKLFHEGQFEGRRVKLPVFLSRRPDEPIDNEVKIFYERLLRLLNMPLFHDGDWQMVEVGGWPDNQSCANLLAWRWSQGDVRFLAVVNYSDAPAQGLVRIPDEDVSGVNWLLNDTISNETYHRKGDELNDPGLYVSLGPWKFHMFVFYLV